MEGLLQNFAYLEERLLQQHHLLGLTEFIGSQSIQINS
jgi:hypothetical protein